jgi:hypothetical protein
MNIEYEEALSLLPAEPGTIVPIPPSLIQVLEKMVMPYGVAPGALARILLEEGIPAGVFAVESNPEAMAGDFTPPELLHTLQQRNCCAVIFVDVPGKEHGHALYWDNDYLIDPKNGERLNERLAHIQDKEFHLIEDAYAVVFIYQGGFV